MKPMLLLLPLLLLSSAARAEEDAKIKIAVLDLQRGGDIPPDVSATISGLIGAHLDKTGVFAVVTEADVKQMISFDRMKTALACDEQASCLSEIGEALGVPYMLTGTLGKLGSQTALSITLIDIQTAKALKRESATFPDVDALLKALDDTVDRTVAELLFKQRGKLLVSANEEGAVVEFDGKAIGTTPLAETEVPSGPHRITVSKEGFIQSAIDVAIKPKEQTALNISLKPSPEFLDAYRSRTGAVRAGAWGTGIGGAVVAAAGVGGVAGFFVTKGGLDGKYGADADGNLQVTDQNDFNVMLLEWWGGLGALAVGAALMGTSGVLFAVGEDPAKYDNLAAAPTPPTGPAR